MKKAFSKQCLLLHGKPKLEDPKNSFDLKSFKFCGKSKEEFSKAFFAPLEDKLCLKSVKLYNSFLHFSSDFVRKFSGELLLALKEGEILLLEDFSNTLGEMKSFSLWDDWGYRAGGYFLCSIAISSLVLAISSQGFQRNSEEHINLESQLGKFISFYIREVLLFSPSKKEVKLESTFGEVFSNKLVVLNERVFSYSTSFELTEMRTNSIKLLRGVYKTFPDVVYNSFPNNEGLTQEERRKLIEYKNRIFFNVF